MKIFKAEYTHIGDRSENEDSCLCEVLNSQTAYAIVADGLGGHGGGKMASKIAVKHLAKCRELNSLPAADNIYSWMKEINTEIFNTRKNTSQMKTTAVFLAIFNEQAVWAHVGDSRLYHFHNGLLADYTSDHSVPQVKVFAGELTRDKIPSSPDRSKLLRALGNEELDPEIHEPVPLQPGWHAFLLCTDGFWEYLHEDEIWLDLLKSRSAEEWLIYLRCRGEMRKNGNADNNTAVALFIEI